MSDPFLAPRLTPYSVDRYIARSALLRSVREIAPELSGTLLDVGCGRMPYKPLIMSSPNRITKYIGMDLPGDSKRVPPDLAWDGRTIPLDDGIVDCALATEFFEHIHEPEGVMREIYRVLKPGGFLFLTVPFLWPLHEVPWDEYRYTPFSLEKHLVSAGFAGVSLKPLGGWDASLAQMLGLWALRRPLPRWSLQVAAACLVMPLIYLLSRMDRADVPFAADQMITGLSGVAFKARG
jgi:SAM-dependent methyltransferase